MERTCDGFTQRLTRRSTVLAQAIALARIARVLDVPVLGTEQNPHGLGRNSTELRELCPQTCDGVQIDHAIGHRVRDDPRFPRRQTALVCELVEWARCRVPWRLQAGVAHSPP